MNKRGICRLLPSLAIAILLCHLIARYCSAVPAAPIMHRLTQSDGSTFIARQWGDEFLHGWETEDGYTIVFDKDLKSWTYAIHGKDGGLISSSKIVLKEVPVGIPKFIRPKNEALSLRRLMRLSNEITTEFPQELTSPVGTYNIPVILINFSNTATTYLIGDFQNLLFGTGNHSMKDYYEEVSYGKFSVSSGPAGIVGWYRAKNTHDYYGQNDSADQDMWPGTLVREAVTAADAAGFNWALYDNDGDCYVDAAVIIHQGTDEAESGKATDIWSHSWNLNDAFRYGYSDGGEFTTRTPCSKGGYIKINDYTIQPETETLSGGMTTMGVYAHEYGHALGLPDLYDTDYSSNGVGDWSLMASGSWTMVSKPGDRPSHLDAWSKYKLGWVTPTQVTRTLIDQPITQVEITPDIYQLLGGGPSIGGEYFLIENRQKVGFDEGLPGAGLLIWHIDERKDDNDHECYPGGPSCVTNHYHVALVQADNLWDLEKDIFNLGDMGDPYPGLAGNTSFTRDSAPKSNLYNGYPSGVSVTNISPSGSIMTATLTPPAETISTPTTPIGRTSGITDTVYTYATGGSISSYGDSVEYQFDWKGDGSTDLSDWGPPTQSKNWSTPGTYDVGARARCKTDTGVVSEWSGFLSVTISAFTIPYTVTTNPPGLQINVDSLLYTSPHTFAWTPGSSHNLSIFSPQSGAPGTRYVFSSWSDGGGQSHQIISPSSSATYTADFTTQYSLTTSVNPSEGGTVSPSGINWFDSGQSVSISATANTGYTLIRWFGVLYGTANPTTISMKRDMLVKAYFQTVGPDLTGLWTKPVTQTCRTTSKGRKCTIKGTLTIRNDGNGDVSSSFPVEFYLSYYENGAHLGEHLKDSSGGAIKAKESKTINFVSNLPLGRTAKGGYIKALINANGNVPEVNTTNNLTISGPIQ